MQCNAMLRWILPPHIWQDDNQSFTMNRSCTYQLNVCWHDKALWYTLFWNHFPELANNFMIMIMCIPSDHSERVYQIDCFPFDSTVGLSSLENNNFHVCLVIYMFRFLSLTLCSIWSNVLFACRIVILIDGERERQCGSETSVTKKFNNNNVSNSNMKNFFPIRTCGLYNIAHVNNTF